MSLWVLLSQNIGIDHPYVDATLLVVVALDFSLNPGRPAENIARPDRNQVRTVIGHQWLTVVRHPTAVWYL